MNTYEFRKALSKYPKDAEVYYNPQSKDIPVKFIEQPRVKETCEKTGVIREKTVLIIS